MERVSVPTFFKMGSADAKTYVGTSIHIFKTFISPPVPVNGIGRVQYINSNNEFPVLCFFRSHNDDIMRLFPFIERFFPSYLPFNMAIIGASKIDSRIILITFSLCLSNLGICIHKSSRIYLLQQTLCLNYYKTNDPSKINPDFTVEESICKIKDVQSALSVTEGVDSLLMALPGKILPSFIHNSIQGEP